MARSLPRSGRIARRGGLRQPTNLRTRSGQLALSTRLEQKPAEATSATAGSRIGDGSPARENAGRCLARRNCELVGRRRCEKVSGWRERRADVYAEEEEEMKGDELASSLVGITRKLDFSALYSDLDLSPTDNAATCWETKRYLTYEPKNGQENCPPNVEESDPLGFSPGGPEKTTPRPLKGHGTSASSKAALATPTTFDSVASLIESNRKAKPITNTWTLDSPIIGSATGSTGTTTRKRKRRKHTHRLRDKTLTEDRRPKLCILQRMFGP